MKRRSPKKSGHNLKQTKNGLLTPTNLVLGQSLDALIFKLAKTRIDIKNEGIEIRGKELKKYERAKSRGILGLPYR